MTRRRLIYCACLLVWPQCSNYITLSVTQQGGPVETNCDAEFGHLVCAYECSSIVRVPVMDTNEFMLGSTCLTYVKKNSNSRHEFKVCVCMLAWKGRKYLFLLSGVYGMSDKVQGFHDIT